MLQKLIFGLAMLLLSQITYSQAYKPILTDSCTWYTTNYFFGYTTDPYFTSTDTIIGNNTYKILDGFHFNNNAFLREDTASRKVYYYQTKGFRANQDILIYDFSLQVGDSMLLFNPNTPVMDSVGYFTLDSIVMKVIKSGSARMFYLSGPKNNLGVKAKAEWIEGVGSTFMINSGGAAGDLNNYGELTCFFQDEQHVYESELSADFGSCSVETVGISEEEDNDWIKILPNPITDWLDIQGSNELRRVKLYSLTGEIILDKSLTDKHEVIDVINLNSGYYMAIIIDNKNNVSRNILLKK